MPKTPWWKFWNPNSGGAGGLIAGLMLAILEYAALLYWGLL